MPEALPPFVENELAALALCAVAPGGAEGGLAEAARLRAVRWRNGLVRLGAPLPLFLVHDFGLVLGTPSSELRIVEPAAREPAAREPAAREPAAREPAAREPAAREEVEPQRRYRALLRALQASEAVAEIAAQRPADELIVALLYRLLADLGARFEPASLRPPRAEVPLARLGPSLLRDEALRRLGAGGGYREGAAAWLRLLSTEPIPLSILTLADLLDPALLRLLSANPGAGSGGGTGAGSSPRGPAGLELAELPEAPELSELPELHDLADLLGVLGSPEVRDVVRFSLQLLPSALAPQRASSAHTFPTGGYAALLSRGPIDAALPHELAGDEELLLHKLLHGELLYYGRDQEQQKPRRFHDVLVDASPSMRGLRQVFARGLALALARRLAHGGGAVRVRCFDGRLHEGVRVDRQPGRLAPYLLGYRSQRGRNYGRVFRDLGAEYAERCRGAAARGGSAEGEPTEIWTYLLTHAECHVAPELLHAVRRHARLTGVFLFPAGELVQDALPLFERVVAVREDVLASEAERRAQALELLEQLTAQPAP